LTTAEASSPGHHPPVRGHPIGLCALRVPPIPDASRLTGRAPGSYPGTDWVRGPGRVPSRRSSARKSAGPSHRRSRVRVPSVAPRRRGRMDEVPVYETGGCRFESCRRRHLVVAQRRERRPPKAEIARSNRADEAVHTPWKRPGWMRSLSRTQVGVAPLGVRVAPLPLNAHHAAMVQRSRHRALNSEIGVRFPVAVLSCTSNHLGDLCAR
jgi:hypothetical protein